MFRICLCFGRHEYQRKEPASEVAQHELREADLEPSANERPEGNGTSGGKDRGDWRSLIGLTLQAGGVFVALAFLTGVVYFSGERIALRPLATAVVSTSTENCLFQGSLLLLLFLAVTILFVVIRTIIGWLMDLIPDLPRTNRPHMSKDGSKSKNDVKLMKPGKRKTDGGFEVIAFLIAYSVFFIIALWLLSTRVPTGVKVESFGYLAYFFLAATLPFTAASIWDAVKAEFGVSRGHLGLPNPRAMVSLFLIGVLASFLFVGVMGYSRGESQGLKAEVAQISAGETIQRLNPTGESLYYLGNNGGLSYLRVGDSKEILVVPSGEVLIRLSAKP